MRSEEMFGLAAARITSRGLLALLVLREAAGATFFHLYDTPPATQICNESSGKVDTAWWAGRDKSLQKFKRQCCNQNGRFPCNSEESDSEEYDKCTNTFSLRNFQHGGIFACKTLMKGSPIPENKNPLFTSKDNCTDFNFFIVAIIKSPAEQRSENLHRKAEENLTIAENQNFTLSCEFELKNDIAFAVYWFKETTPGTCLFSASNEGNHHNREVSYDINCCIDDAFRDRRTNNSRTSGDEHRSQRHGVTITNSTLADNGSYFCVVAVYDNGGYTWTIEHRISVNVMEVQPPSSITGLLILVGAIAAALLLMGGIVLFLCCRKKAKGKPLESKQRDQTTVATEDCTPYATSSHNDLNGPEMIYSLATSPGEAPSAVRFSPQSKPVPGVQYENIKALYSKVLKDKSNPTLASDP